MNIVCPSEERLKSLIMEAFDELPAPDPARIGQIASTLANKTRKQARQHSRPRHHWLFWVLLGGSMTAAAWWGSSHFLPQRAEVPIQIESELNRAPVIIPERLKPNNESSKEIIGKNTNRKIGPIIDQREQY